jgi:predicted DCC family thiol-disulfide oxidoreductase YuxK
MLSSRGKTASLDSTFPSTFRCSAGSFIIEAGWRESMTEHPIILFDAECVLCSANAQFVLTHDRARHFRLAAMQGKVGAALCRRFGINPADPDTIIVVQGDRALRDSDAVLAIYAGLGWPWRIVAAARPVPRSLRDPLYRWVARNRYRLFGKRASCWLPRPEDTDRVL